MKKLLGCVSAVALMGAHSAPVNAQTINYGSLQDLFGEAVTTSATGKPQKASEVPVAMDIITAEEIRRSGAQSIPQVLGRVDGVVNWQSTRGWSDVGMRGQNATINPTLLVLVNGRQVYIDTYGYTDWTLLPVQLEEIRQIEVVKGPNTALFGFNAVSGVINIVTYNPKYDNVNNAGATVGTNEYGKAHLVDTMKLSESTQARVSGSLQTDGEFSANSKTAFSGSPKQGNNHQGVFNVDALSQLSDATQLRLEGSYSDVDTNDMVLYSLSQADKQAKSAKATLSTQTGYGLVEASLYQNNLDAVISLPSVGAISMNNTVTVAQLQDLFKIGADHSFRLLGEYRHNAMTSDLVLGNSAEISYNAGAVGGMWSWTIDPRWELTNAVRVDTLLLERSGPLPSVVFTSNNQFDKGLTELSVNSGIVFKATDADTLRASYARGIQAPSLINSAVNIVLGGLCHLGHLIWMRLLSPTMSWAMITPSRILMVNYGAASITSVRKM